MKDKISLISGNSGVGKTTLLNLLNPSLDLKTGEISDYHRAGKHITTFPEMHPMPFGGYVIDSPGIRGFGNDRYGEGKKSIISSLRYSGNQKIAGFITASIWKSQDVRLEKQWKTARSTSSGTGAILIFLGMKIANTGN